MTDSNGATPDPSTAELVREVTAAYRMLHAAVQGFVRAVHYSTDMQPGWRATQSAGSYTSDWGSPSAPMGSRSDMGAGGQRARATAAAP